MKIYRKHAKTITNKKNNSSINDNNQNYSKQLPSKAQTRNLFGSIDENFGFINSILGNGIGLVEGKYSIFDGSVQIGVVYIDNITDKKLVSDQIIEPLLNAKINSETSCGDTLLLIQSRFLYVPDTKRSNQMEQVIENLLLGYTVIFVDGLTIALIMESRKVENRPIEKPTNEVVASGSLDSLTENLDTNCNLISKRLPTPNLHFEVFTIGRLSRTKVKLLWIEGIANTKVVDEVRSRIQKVNIDIVDGIGALGELICDSPLSLFPTYKQSQRPDVISKSLSDGQFALLCNNSPYGFVAPISFGDNFKTMDDYAEQSIKSSYLRIVRYIAFVLSIAIAPIYLSFVTYNHSIVPPTLAMNISLGRDGVPLPSVLELIILSLAMTIIREASLRIAGTIGFFVGTLSAIVIGQASVTAGYVSASVIIVTAISSISSFAIPTTTMLYTSRLINYFFILIAGVFGMFGLINGIVIILWHMISLESFGVPYFYPLIPFDFEGMKDTFIRAPISLLKKRLKILSPFNRTRMNKGE